MTDLIVVPQPNQWYRLKSLVLDSVSSPITKRVYNLGLDEFFAWYGQEPRAGFTKATVSAWRVVLEARGLGAVSINVRITAVRKLAVEAADNGLLAPELAGGITRVKGVASKGVRLGNWLSARQAQALLNAPDATTPKGLRDRAILAVTPGWFALGSRRGKQLWDCSSYLWRRPSSRQTHLDPTRRYRSWHCSLFHWSLTSRRPLFPANSSARPDGPGSRCYASLCHHRRCRGSGLTVWTAKSRGLGRT